MDWITGSLQSWLVSGVESLLAPGTLRSLVNDGIIAGVGSVIVFLPQILMLFFFIGLLEDCGYMARRLCDGQVNDQARLERQVVFTVDVLVCLCRPGIMARAVIEDRARSHGHHPDRPANELLAAIAGLCFAGDRLVPQVSWLGGWIGLQGSVLFAMHLVGLAVAVPVAWLLKKFFFPGDVPPFVMELPSYKVPRRVWCSIVSGSEPKRF
ncbi:MAG: hypothetical protein R3C56_34490 [Pirellulaceae bacterium]